MTKSGIRTLLLALAVCPLLLAQSADSYQWQSTVTMQMGSMTMPAQSSLVCSDSKDSPPIKQQKDCEMYDVKRTGNTQTYKLRCTGANAVEGSGEITYSGDSYQGKMIMHARQGDMTMTMTGKKLGKCDGTEVNSAAKVAERNQVVANANAQVSQMNNAMAQVCVQQAEQAASPYAFMPGTPGYLCKEPAQKQSYCSHFQTHKAFAKLAETEAQYKQANVSMNGAPLTDSCALCGVAIPAVRASLCATAEQQGEYAFMRAQCPEQTAAIVKRECAGRSYTTVSDKYRAFCSGAAAPAGEQAPAPVPQQTDSDKDKDKSNKSVKKLKGMLGL
jgi:hypothetical protein